MSVQAHPDLPRFELDRENAIRYLQRREITAGAGEKGWQLATFGDMALGWVNILPNRINNYYPRELRILKDI
jgi:NOL1/NOP2/fmu family ribosome biogenesis protein